MIKLPIVAIVGRRNVGKSTLFNSMIKQKRAIVDATPGLTRDIISYNLKYSSVLFTLSDTPGLDLPDSTELSKPILENARDYLAKASAIILLLENPAPTSFDMDLAELIRKLAVPAIIAINKMDGTKELENMSNFHEMGFQDILPISAKTHFNLTLLLDKILPLLPVKKTSHPEADLKITIVGRPNSGKSTLLNSFMGYNRAVVSKVPGTTRDSIDEEFMYQKKKIVVIDTAGIRRKSRISENIEYYSLTRTREAIERCDVAVHLIDAEAGLTETDKKISDEIMRIKKPAIIAINKWDLVIKDHKTLDKFIDRLTFQFYKAVDLPIISISAEKKQRIHRIIETALLLRERAQTKIETSKLNRLMLAAVSRRMPQLQGKIKIYYSTQVGSNPPQFRLYVNNPAYFKKDVLRYLENFLRKELDLEGVPILIHIHGKEKKNKNK